MRPKPGAYVPDSTEGILRVEDLPQPLLGKRARNYRRRPCPRCGRCCYRHGVGHRTLHDLGCLLRDRPRDLRVAYSRHFCCRCRLPFSVALSELAPPGGHYTRRVIALAVRLVAEDGLPYRVPSWHRWRDHRDFVPYATLQNGVEAAVEKRYPAG